MHPTLVMSLMEEFSDDIPMNNPLSGGRVGVGTAAALGFATLAAAAWSRIQRKTWKVNEIGDHKIRLKLAGAYLLTGMLGAGLAARPGTRRAAVVGTAVGVVAAQAPLIWDPFLIKRHPIIGNIWQYTLPVAGAVLGVNAVT